MQILTFSVWQQFIYIPSDFEGYVAADRALCGLGIFLLNKDTSKIRKTRIVKMDIIVKDDWIFFSSFKFVMQPQFVLAKTCYM